MAASRADGADPSTLHGGDMAPNEILESLWLGPAPALNEEYLSVLREAGITHIMNTTQSECFPTPEQLPTMVGQFRIELSDEPKNAGQMAEELDGAVAFMQKAIDEGGKVYVHCAMGVSRSTTVVLAYRMDALNESLREAYNATKAKRDCIKPNEGFMAALIAREADKRGEASMVLEDNP